MDLTRKAVCGINQSFAARLSNWGRSVAVNMSACQAEDRGFEPVVPVVKTLLLAEDGFREGVALLRRLHARESIPPYKGCCENFSQQLFLFKVRQLAPLLLQSG